MERETRKLIEIISDELLTRVKEGYLVRCKNSTRVKDMLFRMWVKVAWENGRLSDNSIVIIIKYLKENPEFNALVVFKEVR